MTFSTDDERWPYMAVLVWIATRSFQITEKQALRTFLWVDGILALKKADVGYWPLIDSATNAKLKLSDALTAGDLSGRATNFTYEGKSSPSFELFSKDTEADCEFPPAEDRGLLRKLEDCGYAPGLLEKPIKGQARAVEWRDLTFARADVLRLWPEHPQAIAYRLANATRWTPPDVFDKASLDMLPDGERVAFSPVVNLLAFGQLETPADLPEPEMIAERMRATYALLAAARDARVELWGTPAARRVHPAYALEPAGPRRRIEPAEFDNDALALSHQCESGLGTNFVAANYPTYGFAPGAVNWIDVTVDRKSLVDWIGSIPALTRSTLGELASLTD
jgi:hypothetical protein